MTNRKLTFVRLEDTSFGGAENLLRSFMSELQLRGIVCQALHSRAPGWLASWLKALYFNYEVKKCKDQQFYFSLSRIDSADIYHASDGVHRVFMKQIGKSFFNNPLHIVTCWLEKRCFHHAKHIIAISNMVKQNIINTYHISPKKISVIHNSVTVTPSMNQETARHTLAQEFHFDPQAKIILFVGNGLKRKGGDAFLQIMGRLNPHYHAFIVGKEKHIKIYQKIAANLGIQNRVTFTGQRKDVNTFFQAADIFLLPARYEPFGNVMLEAMWHHCATITTKDAGAHELLPPELVMTSHNDMSIVNTINTLLDDQNKLQAMQTQCYETAKQNSIEHSVDEILKVVQEVMQCI